MKVNEIMTSEIGCCTLDSSLQEVSQMMLDCDCGAIPVVQDMESKKLMGIITDRDIVIRGVAKGADCSSTTAQDCMTTNPQSVRPDASVDEVEQVMSQSQVRRVPIVDENGCVCGIVSQADLALSIPNPEVGRVVKNVSEPYVA
jgi:CBS domain-containing protein